MSDQFVTVTIAEIRVGEPLPCSLYVYIDFRFITFRADGDTVDRTAYDRLQFKRVKNLFISEKDKPKWQAWADAVQDEQDKVPPLPPEAAEFLQAREDMHRKTLDIFQSAHPDKVVVQTLAASKKMVSEVMKFPYAVQSLSQLQNYSKGTVDHSVNVSVLSVYLAMQMGYSHALILQHVGMGGLLHDIGKLRIPIEDTDSKDIIAQKMQAHPDAGFTMLEGQSKVPNEVKMIVAQHHEAHDGTGYPKKLRGNAIYDLARIVGIANAFDEIVGDGKGTLLERQRAAITELDEKLYRKFDPQKLEKCLRILKLGV